MASTTATNERATGRPNFCVVFVGNIPCDVEAEDDAAAVTLARSLCAFRTNQPSFRLGVLAVLKLDEEGNVIRKQKHGDEANRQTADGQD